MFEKPSKIIDIDKIIQNTSKNRELASQYIKKEIFEDNINTKKSDISNTTNIEYKPNTTEIEKEHAKNSIKINLSYNILNELNIRGNKIKWVD